MVCYIQKSHVERLASSKIKLEHNKLKCTNKQLKQLQRQRSKQYRKAKSCNSPKYWDKYNKTNQQFRMEVKRWKQKNNESKFKQIQTTDGSELLKRVSNILRESKNTKPNTIIDRTLEPKAFNEYVSDKEQRRHILELENFVIDDEFQEKVERAIIRAPVGKTAGSDELFVECFKLFPSITAKLLCNIWRNCGELKYMIEKWQEGELIPIYKRGNKDQPESYRPISLLSHARKMIESAISQCIEKQTEFDKAQLGFTRNASTETAVIRTIRQYQCNMNYIAVLDLQNAYNKVCRQKLIQLTEGRLDRNTSNMIKMCLQPLQLQTRGG